MPPKQAKTDSGVLTLLFKKHRTTVLLSIQPHATLTSTKEKLLAALKSRNILEINGESLPDDSAEIEFGVPIDRSDLEKGWTLLRAVVADPAGDDATKNKTESSRNLDTVLAAGLNDGYSVAFRFRKARENEQANETDMDLELDEPGWDVVLPRFEEQEDA
ncbi:uncharacterized protein N7459_008754 [Penicillium hispanicum]|uniref:uncharacterized protein n=1 Tax=Penicillium hispanicum TaxID=1080232 RepID=UPI00253F754A|nr:uncharacterized protein N7459_008754 [Penicillium hispanicum]KAJ5574327.1 hypothetical protein N7459_008754 [Penicillium hispanicum]